MNAKPSKQWRDTTPRKLLTEDEQRRRQQKRIETLEFRKGFHHDPELIQAMIDAVKTPGKIGEHMYEWAFLYVIELDMMLAHPYSLRLPTQYVYEVTINRNSEIARKAQHVYYSNSRSKRMLAEARKALVDIALNHMLRKVKQEK